MNLLMPCLRTILIMACFLLPLFSNAQLQTPLNLSIQYMEQNLEHFNLTQEDIRNYRVNDIYVSKHTGVTHVYLKQTHKDIQVRNAIININILSNGEILNHGNRFVSDLQRRVNDNIPSIAPEIALQKVIEQFNIANDYALRLQSQKNDHQFTFDPTGIALDPISVKLIYENLKTKDVRLAWMVEVYQLDAQHWWNVRVDAKTGAILNHNDQVIHCNFDAVDNSCSEHGHHHTDLISKSTKPTVSSTLPNDINSYNVFPLFTESPNHGGRELISSPADPIASPFGWHDTNGADGPEFTITRGNNVHAYHDIYNRNASIDDEPDGGSSLDFDFPLNTPVNQPFTNIDPAVVNLFYWNNTIHDLWYNYGFDEASGNFQVNNYGNGGIPGDAVRAEALDGGGTNNANFGTQADGSGARMQMFIWTEEQLPNLNPMVIADAPSDVMGEYDLTPGTFGDLFPFVPLGAEVVLVDDGTGVSSDACEDIINSSDIAGNIALIDRGDCEFGEKILKAENAGAIAVIVCNNIEDDPFPMGPGDFGDQVNIPSGMITLQDCNTLKTALEELTVTIEFPSIPVPGPAARDGDFDNGIIAHEYGHGISIRLTGGPSMGGCLQSEEQAGEGWSDWFGLVMTTTEENTAEEGRGIGTFAVDQATTGDGIREFRYSRDMSVNPHTYGDVPNVAIPHGVGSVWCAMIWDLYWNMVDEYDFDSDIFNGTGGNNMTMQLVMDGLKLQSCSPSFIDSRDAILAADEALYDGANQCLIWETFARRGLGVSASPGGNEAFDIPDSCTPVQIIKSAASEVSAGSTITYTLEIRNNTTSLVSNIEVNDEFPEGTSYVEGSLSCSGGTINGNTLTLDVTNISPNTPTICTYELMVDAEPFSTLVLEDEVEESEPIWSMTNPVGNANWSTNNNSFEGSFAWFAQNITTESDQYLTLSNPITLEGDNPTLAFWHWYDTEATWDGGVVEISTDGGFDWIDMEDNFLVNGYVSDIQDNPASAISGRPAFHGDSQGYIQSVIDLSDYTDLPIQVRFRFATDGAVGGNGWYIDNIQFFGSYHSITNTACVSENGVSPNCDEATTLVIGDLTPTNDLENELQISITPNPSNGIFVLSMDSYNQREVSIQILGVDGRLLRSKTLGRSQGTFEFDLSEYAAGIYFLKVQTDHGQVIERIVLQ